MNVKEHPVNDAKTALWLSWLARSNTSQSRDEKDSAPHNSLRERKAIAGNQVLT